MKCTNNQHMSFFIMIMPTLLWSIPWGHQHLQFFEHTRFELVTLNLELHRNEIQYWFTSHLLYLNNDTLQHRAHMTLGSPAFDPYRFLCSTPSRHLCSLLNSQWFVSCMKSSLSIQILNSILYAILPIWDMIYVFMSHSLLPCLLAS